MQVEAQRELLQRIKTFATPNNKTAAFELTLTVGLFIAVSAAMFYGLSHDHWFILGLVPVAAIMITRIFTIQHDCGHGSYFSSQTVNNIVGSILGVVTFTPYYYWRKNHSIHHRDSGNLDRRGVGDVDTFTVEEYSNASTAKKVWYRIYRNPFFLIFIAPALLFGVKHRLPVDSEFHSAKMWVNIMATNIAIALTIYGVVHFCGAQSLWLAYLPMVWVGSIIGVVMFYIQHQYEGAYWSKQGEWKYFDAALQGSSYFEFSRFFSWLVGNINLHHIHHLNGAVPSYRLRECLNGIPELRAVIKRTLKDIPASFKLALWDDKQGKMVGFA
jgi:omega-6 fatty acid desaturase (delta-12 desaturase)